MELIGNIMCAFLFDSFHEQLVML